MTSAWRTGQPFHVAVLGFGAGAQLLTALLTVFLLTVMARDMGTLYGGQLYETGVRTILLLHDPASPLHDRPVRLLHHSGDRVVVTPLDDAPDSPIYVVPEAELRAVVVYPGR